MMSSQTETIAVLLMAYGSPDRLSDMEAYLLDIRGGRYTSPELVEEISHRYAAIGGRSPLFDITRDEARLLETELNRRFAGQPVRFRTFTGMRHWDPRIRSAVEQIKAAGIRKVVGLVLAPHSSQLSTGAYFAKLDEANQETGAGLVVFRVENWHTDEGLVNAILEKVEERLVKFDETPYILFTAHSLPARILKSGDNYAQQLQETAQILARRLGLGSGRWEFCFQSAGQSQEEWLGPPIEQRIPELIQAGENDLLVVPIGFVSDHVEVLYDIDIAAKEMAAGLGARLERSASLNTSEKFISTLADQVEHSLHLERLP